MFLEDVLGLIILFIVFILQFNNLIADKPEIHTVVKDYKNLLAQNVDNASDLIPDLAKIVAQY